jgi:hypothetical protein
LCGKKVFGRERERETLTSMVDVHVNGTDDRHHLDYPSGKQEVIARIMNKMNGEGVYDLNVENLNRVYRGQ